MGITEEEYREEHRRAIAVLEQFKIMEASFEMKKIKIDHKTVKSIRKDRLPKTKMNKKISKASIDTTIVMDILELELLNEYDCEELVIFK